MFVSTAMNAVDDRRWQVDGDLTIAGVTAPVRIPIEINPAPHGVRLTAAVTIAQSSFGIKPFSALMGALQVADQVRIQAEARVPGSG